MNHLNYLYKKKTWNENCQETLAIVKHRDTEVIVMMYEWIVESFYFLLFYSVMKFLLYSSCATFDEKLCFSCWIVWQ